MILVLVLAFAFLALSIAGQRIVARMLGVKSAVRPLLPFAEGTLPLHQFAIRVGGAFFTWLILFAMCFSVMAREQQYPPIVEVVPGFPAAASGMQTGDRVVQVDGQPVRDFSELKERVAFGAKEKRLLVVRGEQEMTFVVTANDGLIGVKVNGAPMPVSSGTALQRALVLPFRVLRLVPVVLGGSDADGQKRDAAPNLFVGLVLSCALGWWLSVVLELLAFGVNAIARRT